MANIEVALNIASDFIKKWEKLASKSSSKLQYYPFPDSLNYPSDTICYAYKDSGGVPTIGWGTTNYSDGYSVSIGDTITKEQADYEFDYEVRNKEEAIRKFIKYDILTDNQYAACISIAYNAGEGSFKYNNSILLNAINNQSDNVEALIKKHAITINNGATVSQGLINRRLDEAQLWSGDYNELYSYYLRNSTKINGLLIGGILLIGASIVAYKMIKK